MAVGATVITHLSGFEKMATGIHLITLLERIRNCRCYWQLNCFELLRMYLSCTHTPLDSAPSKPLRPLVHLAARFAFTRTAFAAFTFFVCHNFLLLFGVLLIICQFRKILANLAVYTFLLHQPRLHDPFCRHTSPCSTHLVSR